MRVCVSVFVRKGIMQKLAQQKKKSEGLFRGPRGQERGAALLLQPERLCQQGSYRMERGNGPPGKGINQDLQEPKPDKTK